MPSSLGKTSERVFLPRVLDWFILRGLMGILLMRLLENLLPIIFVLASIALWFWFLFVYLPELSFY